MFGRRICLMTECIARHDSHVNFCGIKTAAHFKYPATTPAICMSHTHYIKKSDGKQELENREQRTWLIPKRSRRSSRRKRNDPSPSESQPWTYTSDPSSDSRRKVHKLQTQTGASNAPCFSRSSSPSGSEAAYLRRLLRARTGQSTPTPDHT